MVGNRRRFSLGRCLGRGSFGEVYSASMRSPGGLETPVAVKLLRADLDLQGDALRRLRDEGRLLARLNHPAILKVYDLVTLRGRLALITELVDGADLADCLAPRLPVRALLQVIGQIAGALDAAGGGADAALKLVHRDVKPTNVRIDRHGQAKLLDFGIARFDATDREVRTASDMVVGSVPYMAPERFVQRQVESSSDVFSLGCTLYEGITGERFYGTAQVAKITGLALQPEQFEAHAAERIGALQVAGGVRELLTSMLAFDPEVRPNAATVAARLETLADQIGGPTLRMWCREREWGPGKQVRGTLEGETLEEEDLDAPKKPPPVVSIPVVHVAPHPTLEPGSPNPWGDLREPSGETPTRVDRASPWVPPRKDSAQERPFTEEAAAPSLAPHTLSGPRPSSVAAPSDPPARPSWDTGSMEVPAPPVRLASTSGAHVPAPPTSARRGPSPLLLVFAAIVVVGIVVMAGGMLIFALALGMVAWTA